MWPSKQFFAALKYVGPLAKNTLVSLNKFNKTLMLQYMCIDFY